MKKLTLFALLLTAPFFTLSGQTIWIVDNNPDPINNTNFSSIQEAINAAAVGDIIFIQGSPTSYGSFTLNKRLTIYGTSHSVVPASEDFPATVGNITLDSIAGSTSASGSILWGINTNWINASSGFVPVNLTVQRCFISSFISLNSPGSVRSRNILFEGNIFSFNSSISVGNNSLDVFFRNNIFHRAYLTAVNQARVIITNNVFCGRTSTGTSVNRAIVVNNIFYNYRNTGFGGSAGTSGGVTFNNNISFGGDFTDFNYGNNFASNNIQNVNPNFANAPLADMTGSYNSNWNFSISGAPAQNAGTEGSDIGLSGNGYTFDYLGRAPFPKINSFLINNSSIPQNGTLNITFEAEGGVN